MSRTMRLTHAIELDVEVVCSVSPGEPERGPSYDCAGTPASGPEVEITSATVDGRDVLALLSAEDQTAIEDAAIERAAEAD